MNADDDICPAGHELRTRALPEGDIGISGRAARRSTTAIPEEFETVVFDDDETIRAGIMADPDALGVARRAAEACAEHHGIDLDRARAEIRLLVATALDQGGWRRASNGFWLIEFKGMSALLPPPGQVVLSYRTLHYERLPSEVISGAPSRFGNRRSAGVEPFGDPLPLDEILDRLKDPTFSDRLMAAWTKRFGDDAHLRSRFLAGLAGASWKEDERPGTWVMTSGPQCWRVRADNAMVVASWPTTNDLITSTDPE